MRKGWDGKVGPVNGSEWLGGTVMFHSPIRNRLCKCPKLDSSGIVSFLEGESCGVTVKLETHIITQKTNT